MQQPLRRLEDSCGFAASWLFSPRRMALTLLVCQTTYSARPNVKLRGRQRRDARARQ